MNFQASRSSQSARTRVAYSLAAGAVAGAASNADAFVVYSGIENISIGSGFTQPLEFDGDGYTDVDLSNFSYSNGRKYQSLFMEFSPGAVVGFTTGGIRYVSALGAGVFVDQSTMGPIGGSMAFGSYNPNAQFNAIDNAYIGIGFPISGDGSSGNHFGWIRVSINNAAGKFIINDWAFESVPEVGIVTGSKGDAGDFNNDGKVDAGDYIIWRRALGTGFDLNGHGDENGASVGVVDHDDFTLWSANFGYVKPVGSGATTSSVPEPITLGLLATGSVGLLALRRSRRGK